MLLEIIKWSLLLILLLLLYFLHESHANQWDRDQKDALGGGSSGQDQNQGQGEPTETRPGDSQQPSRQTAADQEQRRRQAKVRKLLEGDPTLGRDLANQSDVDVANPDSILQNPDLVERIASQISDSALDMLEVASRKAAIELDLKSDSRLAEQTGGTDYMDVKPMRDWSELARVRPGDLAGPKSLRRYRLATGRGPGTRPDATGQDPKLLYGLADAFPSMDEHMKDGNFKYIWARGVTVKLVRQALAGKTWFIYRQFDEGVHQAIKVTTPQEAGLLLKRLLGTKPEGNGTPIYQAFARAIKDIKEGKGDITRAEILIITDGQDSSMNDTEKVKRLLGDKTRLHAIMIGGENAALKSVAHSYQVFR